MSVGPDLKCYFGRAAYKFSLLYLVLGRSFAAAVVIMSFSCDIGCN